MESRRAGPRNVAAILFLLLVTFAKLETAQAQVDCYTQLGCNGTTTNVSSARECCLTSEYHTIASGASYFNSTDGTCRTCVVFGWLDGFWFNASEQGEAYSLAVGYIKGAEDAPGNARLRFNVDDTPGTATEGASNDYRVSNTQNLDVRRNTDRDVQVTFRVDNVALEPDESLALTLIPTNTLAMALNPNVFLLETIQLIIEDSDVVTFQFTESDYRTREEEGTVPVIVERTLRIATDVTLRITPVNFTQVNVTGFVFPDDFPDVPDFDPIRPIIASSLPEDERDFNIVPIEVTFPADEINNSADIDAPVSVFDDVVNEADEVFVVLLEVVTNVPLAQVNLVPRNASLCRIVDNDPINIGFEFPRYDFEEQFITFGADSPVFIIKENNVSSEQTFEVVVTAGPAQDPGLEDATPVEAATEGNPADFRVPPVQTFIFEPDEDRIPVPFALFDDLNPELLEGFLLSSSPSEQSPPFLTGANPTTTIAITDDDRLVIGFTETFTSISEGVGELELCLIVTVPPPEVELAANLFVFIEILTEEGTALEILDYVRIDDSTNPLDDFTDGRRFQCFDVTIQDDSRFELTEQFIVTAFPFSSTDPVVVTPNVSVVEIVDNDVIQIGFTAPDYRVPESVGNAVVSISILNSVTVESNITLTVSTRIVGFQATDPEDFIGIQSTIVFTEGGPRLFSVDIPIVDDALVEVPIEEQFEVVIELVDPQTNRINTNPRISTVTIVDDDNIVIGFNPATYTVSESEGSVEVTVELRAGSLEGITAARVTLSATSLTAQEGDDFSFFLPLQTVTLVFRETVTSITVPIRITTDGLVEFTEIFLLNITLADTSLAGRVVLDPDFATVTIFDNDTARIGFEPVTYTVVEDIGTVILATRVLAGRLAEEVTVTFSTENGSAIAGSDYVALTTDLNYIGTQSQTIGVTIVTDQILEDTEYFLGTLTLVPTSLNVVVDPAVANITIEDDDPITIGFDPDNYTVNEDAGTVTFVVRVLSGQLDRSVEVDFFTVDGTAVDSEDYNFLRTVLTFDSTTTSVDVSVTVINDDLYERQESFFGNLTLITTEADVVLNPSQAEAFINDNDNVTIGFQPVTYSVNESAGSVNLFVRVLSGQLGRDVDVRFVTQPGTAFANEDYAPTTTVITFDRNVDQQSVTVGIVSDSDLEEDETFEGVIELASTDAPRVTIAPPTATVTIIDDERVRIGFTQETYNVIENQTPVNVTVEVLEGTLGRSVTILLRTTDGTAISVGEADFLATTVSLVFDQTTTSHVVPITIINDIFLEYDENFLSRITLETVDAADDVTLDPQEATIVIIDDDQVVIGFDPDTYTVNEGDGTLNVTIRVLMGELRRSVTVFATSSDGTALADSDYETEAGPLVFSQAETSFIITLTIIDDNIHEPQEFFYGNLSTSDTDVILNPATARADIIDDDVVSFTFRRPMQILLESVGMGEVCVDKIGQTTETIRVMVTGNLQPGVGVLTQELTFGPDDVEICVSFNVEDDNIALEDPENLPFTLTIIDRQRGVELGRYNRTVVVIMDDDELFLTLEKPSTLPESVGSVEACIVFSNPFARPFDIAALSNNNVTNQSSAEAGADYSVVNMTITTTLADSAAGRVCFPIDITNDNLVEDDEECFAVDISIPEDEPTIMITVGSATCCIVDDDNVTIGFDPDVYSVPESTGQVSVVVRILGGQLERPVEVQLSFTDGTATSTPPRDYVNPGVVTLQFDSVSTERTTIVVIENDNIFENNEIFTGGLDSSDRAVFLNPEGATITIVEVNDEVTIGFQPDVYTVDEDAGTVELFAVLLSGSLERNVLVEFSTSPGTADAGADYETQVVTLEFMPGVTTRSVSVTIQDDTIVESTETFFGNLNDVGDPVILQPDVATVFIRDTNDRVTIGFEQTSYPVEEGNVVEVCAVLRMGQLEREVVVTLSSEDVTAIAPGDYQAIVNEPLTFSETVDRQCRNISTVEDDFAENLETFNLTLRTTDGNVTLDPDEAIVGIINDDRVTIGLEQTVYTVPEGEILEVCAVVVNGTLQRDAVVTLLTSDDSATSTAPADYTTVIQPLTFTPTVSRACVNISSIDDIIYEDTETFNVILTTTEIFVDLMPSSGVVQIIDDDAVTIGFEQTRYSVDERTPSVEVCAIVTAPNIPNPLERSVVVNLSTQNGSATYPDDFTAVSEPLTFSPGNLRQCASIPIINDTFLEGGFEYFLAILTTSAPRVTLSPDVANITIIDDDVVTIGFLETQYTVNEEDGSVTLLVGVITGTLMSEVEVELRTEDGSAVSIGTAPDYSAVTVTLTFDSTTSQSGTQVTIIDDTIDEPIQFFRGRLTLISQANVTVDPDEATVEIIDDDGVVIGLENTTYTVIENETIVTVCARLFEGSLEREVIVTLSTADDTATVADDDYEPTTVDLTFDGSTDRQCVNIPINEDDIIEGPEDFRIILTTTDPDVTLRPQNGTVTIIDNDELTVRFVRPSYTFTENEVIGVIQVEKIGVADQDFDVQVTGGPSTQTDIERSAAGIDVVVTFGAGTDAANVSNINVALTDDPVALEAVETYVAELTVITTSIDVMLGTPSQTTINVLDDDDVTVGFGSPNVTVLESAGQFMMCVVKSAPTIFPVVVTLVNSPISATPGVDYLPATIPQQVTIQPADDRTCFTGDIVDDSIALEGTESFQIQITTATPAGVIIGLNTTTVFIEDDDVVTVRFEQSIYSVTETELQVEVCIVKDLETAVTRDVTLTTREGTATSPADYIGGSFPVTIPTAPNARTCQTITIVEDAEREEDEDFFVDLPTLSNGIQTGNPGSARVIIRDVGQLVNDTVVGDPLYTVPIFVPDIENSGLNSSRVSLCYEVHGRPNAYFNLVTDECTSVNARYHEVTDFLNVIDQIGIRAVDNSTSRCRNIAVSLPNCSIEIDGTEFTGNRYRQGGIYIRRYPGRVRVSVPNCQELTLVMWIFCQRRNLENPFTGDTITTDMIKYEVMRGLNFGHRNAHGLIGQFWNIPVQVTMFTGQLRNGTQAPPGRFVINVTRPNSEPRVFTGWLFELTWEFQEGPCLYSGNRQAGPIYEVNNPNDAVVEGTYRDYQVPGTFDETDYDFGLFNEDLCTP